MTPDELKLLLNCEDDRLEWKQSLRDSNDVCEAVCALANDLGDSRRKGILLIGIAPKTGQVVGINKRGAALDEEQQKLASWLQAATKLYPTPCYDIKIVTFEEKPVFVVTVDPYPVPPVVQVNNVAFVRKGATTYRATDADLQRLRERRPIQMQPFDLRPIRGCTLEDLELSELKNRYEAEKIGLDDNDIFPQFEAWLTQAQLGNPVNGTWTPNPTGLLIFGKSPQNTFPGAMIEFVRYKGVDVEAPVAERKTITGTLPQQLETLWSQLSAHITLVPDSSEGIRSSYEPDYPIDALKELARNLVQHRQYEGTNAPSRVEWYDDRIEFSNPGGPYGRASEGEFGLHSDYRNPVITGWLKVLGFVEQLGRGIRLVRKHLQRNKNPSLETEIDGFTRLIVRRRA